MDKGNLVLNTSGKHDTAVPVKYATIALVGVLSLIALFIAYWFWDGYLYDKDLQADFDREVRQKK